MFEVSCLSLLMTLLRPRKAFTTQSQLHVARARSCLNCAPSPASRACGASKANAPKPVISSHQFTAGSPKVLTRRS